MINNNHSSTLSVSCVFFDTDVDIFHKTLTSLAAAVNHATERKFIAHFELHLINNNPNKAPVFLRTCHLFLKQFEKIHIHDGHGNIGYGLANNIAIAKTQCEYHLILNPDVVIEVDALAVGIEYLNNNPNVGLVAPQAINPHGEIEYLAKRRPTFLVILLRGLNIQTFNRIFKNTLNLYAYKDKIPNDQPFEIELASGCFMLCRTISLRKVNGFSNKYFLYFEDFDLSQKIAKLYSLKYLPTLKIIHSGGNVSSKGAKHIFIFLKSALIFLRGK